jgi:hypothetical protein
VSNSISVKFAKYEVTSRINAKKTKKRDIGGIFPANTAQFLVCCTTFLLPPHTRKGGIANCVSNQSNCTLQSRVVDPDPDWTGFNDLVDLESGSRIRIQGQEKKVKTMIFSRYTYLNLITKRSAMDPD